MLIGRPDGQAGWAVTARTPPQPGPPLKIAGIADFTGSGGVQAATVSARGLLQLWTLSPGAIEPAGEAPGYAAGEGDADLAVAIPAAGPPELVLPVAGRPEIALVQAKGHCTRAISGRPATGSTSSGGPAAGIATARSASPSPAA
ncbi:hypothetical protein MBRA_02673 [Methylobacterium brachiatum]|nr:hypothetical protein MBRA_02673 [Methylobacterium brachiatum]